jgi:UDP-GlcNAc3NAcA epimerase
VGPGLPAWQIGVMLQKCETVLGKEKPDAVVVFGDTNTTLAGALAAVKFDISLIHIEAGLRSYNRKMPEEINRVLVDHAASLLLCPSTNAAHNLAKEGFSQVLNEGRLLPDIDKNAPQDLNLSGHKQSVVNVGDVMYDALLFSIQMASERSKILTDLRLKKKEYYLLTMHRAETTDDADCLAEKVTYLNEVTQGKPVVFPIHPRTTKAMAKFCLRFKEHIRIIEPVGYYDMLMLLRNCSLLFTDSGGMQKEAFWLKVPCVTLRTDTEWPETVEKGWNVLYKDYLGEHKDKSEDRLAYGDGCAAKRITGILDGVL